MITTSVSELVRRECSEPENVLGLSFFDEHLAVVATCGTVLAQSIGANPEVVQLAAFLHDISAIRDITTLREHPKLSANIAAEVLSGNGYPVSRTEAVVRCILSHSVPLQISAASAEEVCLSNADAVSQIVRPAYWLFFAFQVQKLGFEQGRGWLFDRLETNWKNLIDPAKELAREGYTFARRVLSSSRSPKQAAEECLCFERARL